MYADRPKKLESWADTLDSRFPEVLAPVHSVAIDDEFGITLDCEPKDMQPTQAGDERLK
jgi:hypothetical protein